MAAGMFGMIGNMAQGLGGMAMEMRQREQVGCERNDKEMLAKMTPEEREYYMREAQHRREERNE